MTEIISIHSKLYDYSVQFVDDLEMFFQNSVESVTYIISINVYNLYRNMFSNINPDRIFLMNDVENNKNMDTVMEIIQFWRSIGVKKDWKVYCIGGGITQDVTTIASNLYLRNIDWYFFPTTLLSMVDSCIGGKCGINLGKYKNQIGVFYPPQKIYIDIRFLGTLLFDDYLNGWGEILKFSLTRYPDFYDKIKRVDRYIPCDKIECFIQRGILVKKEIIEEDEFDTDLRRVLNYGHTFGHALEAYTNNAIPHGKGVIWGIDVVNYIGWKHGLISEWYYYDIKKLIKKAFIKNEIVISNPSELFDIIKTDKKVKGKTLYFAMLDGPSNLIIYPMTIDEKLKKMFLDYLKDTHEYYSD